MIYLCYILIGAVIGLTLFQNSLNIDSIINSFIYLSEALVTVFVLATTGENYGRKLSRCSISCIIKFRLFVIFCSINYNWYLLISRFEQAYRK